MKRREFFSEGVMWCVCFEVRCGVSAFSSPGLCCRSMRATLADQIPSLSFAHRSAGTAALCFSARLRIVYSHQARLHTKDMLAPSRTLPTFLFQSFRFSGINSESRKIPRLGSFAQTAQIVGC
jgi:hypothetical protein